MGQNQSTCHPCLPADRLGPEAERSDIGDPEKKKEIKTNIIGK